MTECCWKQHEPQITTSSSNTLCSGYVIHLRPVSVVPCVHHICPPPNTISPNVTYVCVPLGGGQDHSGGHQRRDHTRPQVPAGTQEPGGHRGNYSDLDHQGHRNSWTRAQMVGLHLTYYIVSLLVSYPVQVCDNESEIDRCLTESHWTIYGLLRGVIILCKIMLAILKNLWSLFLSCTPDRLCFSSSWKSIWILKNIICLMVFTYKSHFLFIHCLQKNSNQPW